MFIIPVSIWRRLRLSQCLHFVVPACSPSRGEDVTVYALFLYSVLVSVSVLMAFSTVFHSINSPDNSSLSHSVLLILFLP